MYLCLYKGTDIYDRQKNKMTASTLIHFCSLQSYALIKVGGISSVIVLRPKFDKSIQHVDVTVLLSMSVWPTRRSSEALGYSSILGTHRLWERKI